MAKRLICTAPHTLEWATERDPEPGDQDVCVRSTFSAAKHGTDLAIYSGEAFGRGAYDPEQQLFKKQKQDFFAGPVGNMVVGEVTKAGPAVQNLLEGDRVVAAAPFSDVHVLAAQRCRKVPDSVPDESAVCLDPASCALGAVRDGHVRIGDHVAVFGMGAIGLCTVQASRIAGAAVIIAIDPLASRREVAAELGAHIVLDPLSCDAGMELKASSSGRGVDVAIDFSGHRDALQDALRGVAFGGCVVAASYPSPYPAGLDFGAEAHLHIPDIVFSRSISDPNRDHPRWDQTRICDTVWRWIMDGRIDGRLIVTPVVPFEDAREEYARVISDSEAGIKLGIRH